MLRDHGTWSVREVLAYAIGYARHGAPLVPRIRATIESVRPLFESDWPTSAALWLRGGGPEPGGLYANPVLADTYERVVREAEAAGGSREKQIDAARAAWYRGFVAEAIDRFAANTRAMDTSGRRHRGVLNGGRHGALVGEHRGAAHLRLPRRHGAQGRPLEPGSGDAAKARPAGGLRPRRHGPGGRGFRPPRHRGAKLAFADREAFYGDPDFVDVPMDTLLSNDYNDARRALITDRASIEFRPGRPDGFAPRTDYAAAIAARQGWPPRRARRADGLAARRGRRRHLPYRCHRPPRQHGERHAVRRLAAVLAGHPGTRLLPRLALPDVLAGRGRCPTACSRASGRARRSRRPWRCAMASPA